MGVHVIEWGNQEDVDYITIGPTKKDYEEVVASTHALICENCGAPMTRGTYKCEYCGTEYISDVSLRNELAKKKERELVSGRKNGKLEMARRALQTARLYKLMGMNAELKDIAREMKEL